MSIRRLLLRAALLLALPACAVTTYAAQPGKGGQFATQNRPAAPRRQVDHSVVNTQPGARSTQGRNSQNTFRPVEKVEFDPAGVAHTGPHVTNLQTGQISDYTTYAAAVAAAESLNKIQAKADRKNARDERKGNNDNKDRGGNTPTGKDGVDGTSPTP